MREETPNNIVHFYRRYTAASLKLVFKKILQEIEQEEFNSLAWAKNRGLSAKVQYYLFCELEAEHPEEAILYR